VTVSGKSEHIWDRFTHEGGHVDLNATGDVACDSYHKWRDDIAILQEVGVSIEKFQQVG
jgi:beta-glucosidase/6-phospho-beta-glucosidase/beta-galactosidase